MSDMKKIRLPGADGDDPFKLQFPKYLAFLLQFRPENPQDKDIRSKMAIRPRHHVASTVVARGAAADIPDVV